MFNKGKRVVRDIRTIVALTILLVPLIALMDIRSSSAADLLSRSVVIGSSAPSATTTQLFSFDATTAITIGSLELEYCTNSPLVGDPCTVPTGLSVLGASIGSQTGLTGFSIHGSTTANRLILTRTPGIVTPVVSAAIRLDNVLNSSVAEETTYVRISTFATTDATGPRGDTGTVAYSINTQLGVSGFVPPFLTFCVGTIVAPDCSATTNSLLSFGEFSTATPRALTSQFAVATNDPFGYTTAVLGNTLTSGNNEIAASLVPTPSIIGVSQFGINLRSNSSPLVGANITGIGSGSPAPNYNIPNSFIFDGGTIASSSIPTEFNTYTVSYLVNISTDQPPGVYSSTLTYVTTVAF